MRRDGALVALPALAAAAATPACASAGPEAGATALVLGLTLLVIVACVLLHYEGLTLLQQRIGHLHLGPRRLRVLFGIVGVLLMHAVEIVLFAAGYSSVLALGEVGAIGGMGHPRFLDLMYFSAITYTTVGYGDLAPLGELRFMAAAESLAGFVLVSWSASFTYLVMERFWQRR
ncbi:MAG: two pore domain potassium channel family protein [Xanthomonadales bacterium]|nr:hypothetical protein [Xanthomonadales bacterium]MCC6593034.1 two pore domain potassium channel family protein [Xanthomonadales bacterium]MCE7931075.1 two pore domain potassium channel family protein [Xanthomonadales bacterium PRO6]